MTVGFMVGTDDVDVPESRDAPVSAGGRDRFFLTIDRRPTVANASPLITHRMPPAEVPGEFSKLLDPGRGVVKAIVEC